MRRLRLQFLIAVLLVAVLPRMAGAQPEVQDVGRELERTDRIIERARDQVGISTAARASQYLTQAISVQQDAHDNYRKGPRHHRAAMVLTMKARDLARRALETAEIEVKAHQTIRDLIDSTEDLLREATDLVRDSGDPQCERLLESGRWQLQRAREAYRSVQYVMALRLAATARDLIQRSIERAKGLTAGDPRSLEIALDRTDALLQEVEIRIAENPDPRAAKARDEATVLQRRARDLARTQRPMLALRLTNQARQSAVEALLLISRNPTAEEVERAIEVVGQLIATMAPEIEASGSERAVKLLESARTRHAEAAALLASGKLPQAMEGSRIAEGLLRRSAEAAGVR